MIKKPVVAMLTPRLHRWSVRSL